MTLFLLFLASFVAAALNAIAGGGTFLTFPTLTGLAKLSEKVANVTSTIGLWPGYAGSIGPAMGELRKIPRPVMVGYVVVGFVGGALGAALLLVTPSGAFKLAVPWLLLFATAVFALGPRVRRWAGRADAGPAVPTFTPRVIPLLLLISMYNGYFGAGAGILMMAGLSLAGLHDLRQINALKVVIQVTANASAVAVFALGDGRGGSAVHVRWDYVGIMAAASVVGGFAGMAVAQRLPQAWVRAIVLTMGAALSVVYFKRIYWA